jgi:hypothetical protein
LKFQVLTVNIRQWDTSTTMPKRSSRLDMSQLAKRIVDKATGAEPITPPPAQKNQSADITTAWWESRVVYWKTN